MTRPAASSSPSRPLRSPLPEPRVRGRILVIYNRCDSLWGVTKVQGLFSEFFAVLGALRYAEQHGAVGVRVYFDSNLYRDDRRGANWWSYFFDEYMPIDSATTSAPETHCRGWHRFGPHAWNESWTTQIIPRNSNLRPYPLDSDAELREAARLTQRYIRVRADLLAKVDSFLTAHRESDEFTIGLHFRGTDKVLAYPYRSPSFESYERQVNRVLAKYQPSRYRIFVATDQTEFADWAREKFGDRMFIQEDAPRISVADTLGRTHGTHKHPGIPSHRKGEAAVMKCLLLSRCDYLIKNRSSLSDISLAFNPKLAWTFVLDDGEVIHGDPAT